MGFFSHVGENTERYLWLWPCISPNSAAGEVKELIKKEKLKSEIVFSRRGIRNEAFFFSREFDGFNSFSLRVVSKASLMFRFIVPVLLFFLFFHYTLKFWRWSYQNIKFKLWNKLTLSKKFKLLYCSLNFLFTLLSFCILCSSTRVNISPRMMYKWASTIEKRYFKTWAIDRQINIQETV